MSRSDEISARLEQVKLELDRSEFGKSAHLIVVTKTFPVSDVEILYQLGQREFGENRDEEGAVKSKATPGDAIWHFQGGIQSNKLRSIVQWADYIHSLDEVRHAIKISALAIEMGKQQSCFIQINLDGPDTRNEKRSGIAPGELSTFVSDISELPGIKVVGVMGVAPLNGDPAPAFALLQECSTLLKSLIPGATFISAGMSGDYQVALKHGATHIRLGSSILGTR